MEGSKLRALLLKLLTGKGHQPVEWRCKWTLEKRDEDGNLIEVINGKDNLLVTVRRCRAL